MKSLVLVVVTMFLLVINSSASENKTEEKDISKTTLSGVVMDKETGELLTGVEIKLDEGNKIVYTDFEGTFSFEGIKSEKLTLTASYISYEDQSKQIYTKEESGKKIKIELKNLIK